MTMAARVQKSEHDGITVISPIGEFDISSVETLRSVMAEAVTPEANRMILDLAETEFVDSLALGAMLGAGRRANELGGWVRLVAPTAQVSRVLAITGLDKVFGVYDTRDLAVVEESTAAGPSETPEHV